MAYTYHWARWEKESLPGYAPYTPSDFCVVRVDSSDDVYVAICSGDGDDYKVHREGTRAGDLVLYNQIEGPPGGEL